MTSFTQDPTLQTLTPSFHRSQSVYVHARGQLADILGHPDAESKAIDISQNQIEHLFNTHPQTQRVLGKLSWHGHQPDGLVITTSDYHITAYFPHTFTGVTLRWSLFVHKGKASAPAQPLHDPSSATNPSLRPEGHLSLWKVPSLGPQANQGHNVVFRIKSRHSSTSPSAIHDRWLIARLWYDALAELLGYYPQSYDLSPYQVVVVPPYQVAQFKNLGMMELTQRHILGESPVVMLSQDLDTHLITLT